MAIEGPREVTAFDGAIEPDAITQDAAVKLGLPAALKASDTISAKRSADAFERIADALERLATTAEAREARESGATP